MHQYVSYLNLPLYDLIEVIEKIRDVFAFAVQKRVNDVLDVHLGVIELIHAQGCSHDYLDDCVPVAMFWEWMKLRLLAAVRSPR